MLSNPFKCCPGYEDRGHVSIVQIPSREVCAVIYGHVGHATEAEGTSFAKEVALALFLEPGELHRAWKRAEHCSRRELPCAGLETCLIVAWTWFGISGSEDDYRGGQGGVFTR